MTVAVAAVAVDEEVDPVADSEEKAAVQSDSYSAIQKASEEQS